MKNKGVKYLLSALALSCVLTAMPAAGSMQTGGIASGAGTETGIEAGIEAGFKAGIEAVMGSGAETVYAAATGTDASAASADTDGEQQGASGYDAVYVIDNSKSVWNQSKDRNEAFETITDLAVGTDVRIGAVFFADHTYKSLPLTSVEDQNGANKVKDFLNMTETDSNNIDTNIGAALEDAISLFDNSDPDRQKIVILFSDGINENAKGEASYTEAADALTEKEVAILKEQNIPVYCVYLQKSRNDEAYLKELVNYFSDDVDYSKDRFSKVTSDNIDTLSSTFADTFYIIQSDVKEAQENPQPADTESTEASTENGTESTEGTEAAEGTETGTEAAGSTEGDDSPEGATESTEAAAETGTETADANAAAASESESSIMDSPLIIIGAVLIIILLLLFLLLRKRKGGNESGGVTTFEKAQTDYRNARDQSDWTKEDFDDECEKLNTCLAEMKKRGIETDADLSTLTVKAEALKVKAEPILAARETTLTNAQPLMKADGKGDAKALKASGDELAKQTAELKAIVDEFVSINKTLEEEIMKH